MLVLARKRHESIIMFLEGKKIEVTVTEIKGNFVRIGVDAPPEVGIMRNEIVEDQDGTSKDV